MNLKWIFFAILSVFMLVEETIALNEITMYRNVRRTPLALVRKQGSATPQLAKPQDHEHDYGYANYYYDGSEDENGDPKEEFFIACPEFYDGNEPATKEYWTETDTPAKYGKVLFQTEFIADQWQCFWELVPSVKKIEKENAGDGVKYCSQSQAAMYGVGYELTNSKGTDIQYAFVYKICFSESEGKTLYSIHRIETPSLLFRDHTAELPDFNPFKDSYDSFLDSSLSTKTLFQSEKYYAHQHVGIGDMLIRPWKLTTKFLFNYTPIARNPHIFKGMARADIFVRLYSRKTNKPLTLYSGPHEEWVKSKTSCWPWSCEVTRIDSFWRIIVDDEGRAIILVTQHTLEKCGNAYLCEKNRQVKTYRKGGCIYTCSLNANDPILRLLDLPDLKITGDLDFTIQTETTNIGLSEKQKSTTKKSTDIFRFLRIKRLLDAIARVDPVLAKRMIEYQQGVS